MEFRKFHNIPPTKFTLTFLEEVSDIYLNSMLLLLVCSLLSKSIDSIILKSFFFVLPRPDSAQA